METRNGESATHLKAEKRQPKGWWRGGKRKSLLGGKGDVVAHEKGKRNKTINKKKKK